MKSVILFFYLCQLNFLPVSDQINKEKNISIYPNPATDHFKISDTKDLESIIIYNLIGKPVKTIKDFSDNMFFIDELQDGTYLVQFNSKNNNTLQTSKLTKRN